MKHDDDDSKKETVTLHTTASEKKFLVAKAKQSGRSIGNFIRNEWLTPAAEAYRNRQDRKTKRTNGSDADSAIILWTTGPDGACTSISPGWTKYTGRPTSDDLGDMWAASVHPDDQAAVSKTFRDAMKARIPFTVEYRLRRHDGIYTWRCGRGWPNCGADGTFFGYAGTNIAIAEPADRPAVHIARHHAP